jgi:NAD(P)-dependent dehydrogenase (short-subunit alcohol dehydrogenase family)
MSSMKGNEGMRCALVTGAASGIGKAASTALARRGIAVVVADVDEDGAQRTALTICAEGFEAVACRLDVTVDADCAAAVQMAMERYGRLDYAFNNAGILPPPLLTAKIEPGAWARTLEVNLTGVFQCMRHELVAMMTTGGGSIVNTASVMATVGGVGVAAYAAAKHGVLGLTKSAALEYGPKGIRVNSVCPGFISTPMITHASVEVIEAVKGRMALRRLGQPEEVAAMVSWLCSDESSFVSGAHFPVDGGYTAS